MAVKKKTVSKKVEYVTVRKISNGFVVTSTTGGVYGPSDNTKEVFCSTIEEVLDFVVEEYNG